MGVNDIEFILEVQRRLLSIGSSSYTIDTVLDALGIDGLHVCTGANPESVSEDRDTAAHSECDSECDCCRLTRKYGPVRV